MSSVFFFEFLEDLPYLKKLLDKDKDLLVISTNFITSDQLIKDNIKFIELKSFFKNKKTYEKHLKHSLLIPKLLEKSLFTNFKKLHEKKWNIIEDYFYPIKICYDQMVYYSFCLDKIIKKYKPKIIYVKFSNKPEFTKDTLIFNPKNSILNHLLKSSRQKIKIKSINRDYVKENKTNNFNYDFNQVKNKFRHYLIDKNKIKKKIISKNDTNIISLSCYETELLILKYPQMKKKIINLSYLENFLNQNNYEKQNDNFIRAIKKDPKIKKFFLINNFDTSKIFIMQISKILLSFENIIQKFEYYSNLIDKINTRLIIFSTMTPFNPQNIVFNKICEIKKIPKVTWCHGGYCTMKLTGYDVTDFKICSNHFSYGHFLNRITGNKNFLPKKIFKKKYQSFSVGSIVINQKYNSLNQGKMAKKKILFIRGNLQTYNQLYFPLGNTNSDINQRIDSSFLINKKILNTLKNYQYDYEIIFKNYPSSANNGYSNEDNIFWKNFLKENGMNNIEFISNKKNTEQLLCNNQLVILPWLSTTFFQSLPFKNKIFMYDKTCFNEYFKDHKDDIFYYDDINKFTSSLEKFLPTLNKTKFSYHKDAINYFLNGNKLSNIKKSFDKSIDFILRNKDC